VKLKAVIKSPLYPPLQKGEDYIYRSLETHLLSGHFRVVAYLIAMIMPRTGDNIRGEKLTPNLVLRINKTDK